MKHINDYDASVRCVGCRKLPRPYRPDIDMAEIAAAVITDAANLQGAGLAGDLGRGETGNADVYRHAAQMETPVGDATFPGGAQHCIGARRAIPGNDIDRVADTDLVIENAQQIEQAGIDGVNIAGAEIAQDIVDLLQRGALIAAPAPVGSGQFFVGVGVDERQGARPTNGASHNFSAAQHFRRHCILRDQHSGKPDCQTGRRQQTGP